MSFFGGDTVQPTAAVDWGRGLSPVKGGSTPSDAGTCGSGAAVPRMAAPGAQPGGRGGVQGGALIAHLTVARPPRHCGRLAGTLE